MIFPTAIFSLFYWIFFKILVLDYLVPIICIFVSRNFTSCAHQSKWLFPFFRLQFWSIILRILNKFLNYFSTFNIFKKYFVNIKTNGLGGCCNPQTKDYFKIFYKILWLPLTVIKILCLKYLFTLNITSTEITSVFYQ